MKKTGQFLKEKREAAGLSLSEVALATKINPKVLTAIESGDEAHLPAKTFLKGFVRSYALFLKLDVEEVMSVFHDETGGPIHSGAHTANLIKDPPVDPQTSRRRVGDENSSSMRTAAVVVIVLLIGLIIGVRELIEKYQREKVIAATEPAKENKDVAEAGNTNAVPNPSAATTVPSAPVTTAAPSAPPTTTEVAPKPADTKAEEDKRAEEKLAEDKKLEDKRAEEKKAAEKLAEEKKIEEKKAAEKTAELKKEEKAAAAEPAPASESDKKQLSKVKNEIILEALDNVEVKMNIKGETKKLSLGPTQVHTVRSAAPVIFDFSDGGAVSITVNGHERGPAGELGKPKQVTIP